MRLKKAHSDVFHVLLQVLDDGRITDSQGRTVDFKNTIIILTSNIGSSYLLEGGNQGAVLAELRNHFRPEFLNRLDEILFFHPLEEKHLSSIIHLIVADLNRRLAEKDLSLILTEGATQRIIEEGYDPNYGARPLKRYVQKHVETLVAKAILRGEVSPGMVLTLDVNEQGFCFVDGPAQ